MHYRAESEGVPRVNVSISYTDQDWYTTLTRKVTSIIQWEERALVAAGMSMLWVPQNPMAYPVYGFKGKGYSLLNMFDPNVGGAIVVAALPEGQPGWVDQIRNNFLHPSSESMTTYPSTILGPQRGATREPDGEGVFTPVVDPQVAAAKQTETRKKKREERTEEKTTEEPVVEPPHAGVKRPSRDPDVDATLTEMMMKRKVLEDKKRKLDAQAAAMLSEKKSKSMGETVAPSESEIDLGVFSKKSVNRLEKLMCVKCNI
ncbi:hypothetical protein HanRHA438_Chr17g0818621 [Helianthus annuus]|nr:hypothetical protein HanRHA438_Chr17g0818621 [Helianthus annuus]